MVVQSASVAICGNSKPLPSSGGSQKKKIDFNKLVKLANKHRSA